MRLTKGAAAFGRHESFPLRYGWLTKGLSAVQADPAIFSRKDAPVELGVGKNMVAAIRYWLLAAGLAQPATRGLAMTQLGKMIFAEDGDRYLEDEATIWLLHWLLASNAEGATAIYWFFNHFHKLEFSAAEVAAALGSFVRQNIGVRRVAVSTLKRDAALVLRMYTRSLGEARRPLEEALDSPLANLDLVERIDRSMRRSEPAERRDLPTAVLAFAVAQLFKQLRSEQLSVEQLVYSSMSHCAPGAVFRMTENGLIDRLEALCAAYPEALQLRRTVGTYQLYRLAEAPLDELDILAKHYLGARSEERLAA